MLTRKPNEEGLLCMRLAVLFFWQPVSYAENQVQVNNTYVVILRQLRMTGCGTCSPFQLVSRAGAFLGTGPAPCKATILSSRPFNMTNHSLVVQYASHMTDNCCNMSLHIYVPLCLAVLLAVHDNTYVKTSPDLAISLCLMFTGESWVCKNTLLVSAKLLRSIVTIVRSVVLVDPDAFGLS
jgi:hypothetical protein